MDEKINCEGRIIEGNKSRLLYDGEEVDIGFLIPVKVVKKDISRSGYADAPLTARMKIRQTNNKITHLKSNVDEAIEDAKNNTPISLHSEVIADMSDILLTKIKTKLNPDKFEKLVFWYLDKIGADKVDIPSKNQSGKSEDSDGDIVATFELLKVIILVQVKYHNGQTNEWGVEQIHKYSQDMYEIGDREYTYINWVLTAGDNFSEQAVNLAQESNTRLINGKDFAEMLVEVGLEGLDEAFI